jgi:hypothetical protein
LLRNFQNHLPSYYNAFIAIMVLLFAYTFWHGFCSGQFSQKPGNNRANPAGQVMVQLPRSVHYSFHSYAFFNASVLSTMVTVPLLAVGLCFPPNGGVGENW